jgi:transcriptional regulator with XRE-family HTH domain
MPVATMRPKPVLVFEGRRALGLSREKLGKLLGWSKRTMARWEGGHSSVSPGSLGKLAQHVHPVDPKLADEIARAGGATLESLGLVAPVTAAAPPAPVPGHVMVDAVVCAAADALKAVPDTVRSALLAAFRRARELRMTVDDVEAALSTKR